MARQACEMRRVEKKDGKEGKGQKAHMMLDCCIYVDDKCPGLFMIHRACEMRRVETKDSEDKRQKVKVWRGMREREVLQKRQRTRPQITHRRDESFINGDVLTILPYPL